MLNLETQELFCVNEKSEPEQCFRNINLRTHFI
jgi:hypothetical protein